MKIKLIVDGGDIKPSPVIAQQIGPLGINIGKVISDINLSTSGFKGIKVPVEVDVNTKTKEYTIKVFSPPTAELIKKEAGLEKGSGTPHNIKVGNLPFERIIDIAKTKSPSLLAVNLKNSVKLVVGTCVSLGVLIDNKDAKEIEKDIDSGNYDKEIEQEITQPSLEKANSIKEFFAKLKEKQDKELKAIAEAKAAEEAAKAAATTAASGAASLGVAPGAAAPTTAGAATASKKDESKPSAKKK